MNVTEINEDFLFFCRNHKIKSASLISEISEFLELCSEI